MNASGIEPLKPLLGRYTSDVQQVVIGLDNLVVPLRGDLNEMLAKGITPAMCGCCGSLMPAKLGQDSADVRTALKAASAPRIFLSSAGEISEAAMLQLEDLDEHRFMDDGPAPGEVSSGTQESA